MNIHKKNALLSIIITIAYITNADALTKQQFGSIRKELENVLALDLTAERQEQAQSLIGKIRESKEGDYQQIAANFETQLKDKIIAQLRQDADQLKSLQSAPSPTPAPEMTADTQALSDALKALDAFKEEVATKDATIRTLQAQIKAERKDRAEAIEECRRILTEEDTKRTNRIKELEAAVTIKEAALASKDDRIKKLSESLETRTKENKRLFTENQKQKITIDRQADTISLLQ